MSDSVQPHRRQPIRLPRPWDSPGKNTGVGCHFLLQCMKVKSESEVAKSCLTRSDPMDCSLPGSSVHGIFQARLLEWGAIAFSHSRHKESLMLSLGLPRWFSGKESACQCKRCKGLGFNPWVGKISCSRKWQPVPVFLPGKFHGQRSLVGCSPWDSKELDMTERTHTAFLQGIHNIGEETGNRWPLHNEIHLHPNKSSFRLFRLHRSSNSI